MFKRFGLRFSLLTLLLLVTLAAVSTSHVLTTLQNRELNARATKQQWIIRQQNDELGRLNIVDSNLVCIINTQNSWYENKRIFGDQRPPNALSWEFYVPVGSRWKVFWATSDLPLEGLPVERQGGIDLVTAKEGPTNFKVSFQHSLATGWRAEVRNHLQTWEIPLSIEEAKWLEEDESVAWNPAGEGKTQASGPDFPVVLLRIRPRVRDVSGGGNVIKVDPKPCPGFMIWIEPATDE